VSPTHRKRPPTRPLEFAFRSEPLRTVRRIARLDLRTGWLVGGAVRDLLCGRRPADWDLTVPRAELPGWLDALAGAGFGRAVPLGRDPFPLYRFVGSGRILDVGPYLGGSFEADLARRDFTINAMALDVASGELVDPYRGRTALKRRVLSAVAERNFREDPLRALRGVRFMAENGYRLDRRTEEILRASAAALGRVAPERIRAELLRLLAGEHAGAAVRTAARLGLFGRILGVRSLPRGRFEVLERLDRAGRPALETRELGLARLAALFWVAGQTTGAALDRLRRLRFSREECRTVHALLLAAAWLPVSDAEVWRLARQLQPEARLFAAFLGALRPEDAEVRRLIRRLRKRPPLPRATGGDIRNWTGLPPGPAIGQLLEKLRDAEFRGSVRNRRQARDLVVREASKTPRRD
jgi:tRNA nucleotidyltransferase (CCA-adding enzyme)